MIVNGKCILIGKHANGSRTYLIEQTGWLCNHSYSATYLGQRMSRIFGTISFREECVIFLVGNPKYSMTTQPSTHSIPSLLSIVWGEFMSQTWHHSDVATLACRQGKFLVCCPTFCYICSLSRWFSTRLFMIEWVKKKLTVISLISIQIKICWSYKVTKIK